MLKEVKRCGGAGQCREEGAEGRKEGRGRKREAKKTNGAGGNKD